MRRGDSYNAFMDIKRNSSLSYKTKVVGPGSKIQHICGYLVIYFATRFIHKVATSDTPFVVEYTVNVYRDFQISTGILFFFF